MSKHECRNASTVAAVTDQSCPKHESMLTKAYSPPFQGGVAARSRRSREATLARADGVVARCWMQPPHPLPIRMLCNIFLRSRPPLLEKEGNMPLPLRVTSIPRNIFFLIVGFLLMLASAAAGQVLKTAK